jgi:hypothetical protein
MSSKSLLLLAEKLEHKIAQYTADKQATMANLQLLKRFWEELHPGTNYSFGEASYPLLSEKNLNDLAKIINAPSTPPQKIQQIANQIIANIDAIQAAARKLSNLSAPSVRVDAPPRKSPDPYER